MNLNLGVSECWGGKETALATCLSLADRYEAERLPAMLPSLSVMNSQRLPLFGLGSYLCLSVCSPAAHIISVSDPLYSAELQFSGYDLPTLKAPIEDHPVESLLGGGSVSSMPTAQADRLYYVPNDTEKSLPPKWSVGINLYYDDGVIPPQSGNETDPFLSNEPDVSNHQTICSCTELHDGGGVILVPVIPEPTAAFFAALGTLVGLLRRNRAE